MSLTEFSEASFTCPSSKDEIWRTASSLTPGSRRAPHRACFAAGEEIYGQEEAADLIYLLVKGSIRTTHLLPDGRRQIGDFYYAGDVFGVEPGPEHRFSAEALTVCEIMVVKRSGSAAYETGRVERLVWGATATELARAQSHMLDMADRFRGDLVTLPMSRQDMADYLGLTIETVSRMLGRLQADGVVELAGCRHFRVRHRGGLMKLAAA